MSEVPAGPSGIVIAVQYWEKDEAAAMRLARLLADLEPGPRTDATILLIRRFDIAEPSRLTAETAQHVSKKFPVMVARSKREGVGHPAGCNALMGGTMDHLSALWKTGRLGRSAVFLAEADGCPLRSDWLDVIIAERQTAMGMGKPILGCYMSNPPHLNGTLAMSIPWWIDHPSVQQTPDDEAWDIYHRETILAAARPMSGWPIANIHGSREWTMAQLLPMAKNVAWLTSAKDQSVIEWAERTLVAR